MKYSNDEENTAVAGDFTKELMCQIWHGEFIQSVKDMYKKSCGFMQSEICYNYSLTHMVAEELLSINGRELSVNNSICHYQEIRK